MNSRVSGAVKTIIFWIVLFAVFVGVLHIPGVIDLLNSTRSVFEGKSVQRCYTDLEYENSLLRETLSEISYRLDELYWDADGISSDMVPAWSYLTEHDPDSVFSIESAAGDLEDASVDMQALMQEILKLESLSREALCTFN